MKSRFLAQTLVTQMTKKMNFDWFVKTISSCFNGLPDGRRPSPAAKYAIGDVALSAFSMFFSQCPSFLQFQRNMKRKSGKSNAGSLFGVGEIPSDNQIRNVLDDVPDGPLSSVFDEVFDALETEGLLNAHKCLGGRFLISMDGTQFFSSDKISCGKCLTARHKNGTSSHSHKAVTAVLVAPGNPCVVPLAPEFIGNEDGALKQDCEINAGKRWIAKNRRYAEKGAVMLGDDLYSREPFCRALSENGFDYVLVCKRESHKTLYEYVDFMAENGDMPVLTTPRKRRGNMFEQCEYRFANGLPIKDGDGALEVNWVEVVVRNAKTGEITYKNAFATRIPLSPSNVAEVAGAGRARWKVENENYNVLKNRGYHLEHNFGHGKKNLSNVLFTLNLLSFLSHVFLGFVDRQYVKVRRLLVARKSFFGDFATLTKYFYFLDWDSLLRFMLEDTCSSPMRPT